MGHLPLHLAVLHKPEYRNRYAANLRRELPLIPLDPVSSLKKYFEGFSSLARAGKRLAELHVHYEQQPEFALTKTEKAREKLDYRVTKMKLSRIQDFHSSTINSSPSPASRTKLLRILPPLDRSALEWLIDQYQVSTDKRSGIVNDPNRSDDPQYILRLVGQVITVSLETMKILGSLPSLGFMDAGNNPVHLSESTEARY